MIVVDVGCKSYPYQDSITALIARFKPDLLYGFDPASSQIEGEFQMFGTRVVMRRCAMWVYDGYVPFTENGTRSHVLGAGEEGAKVCCLDIAEWLAWLATNGDQEIVLKLDVEGAEYALLSHIANQNADLLLDLVLVEWHERPRGVPSRKILEDRLRVTVEDWHE